MNIMFFGQKLINTKFEKFADNNINCDSSKKFRHNKKYYQIIV